MEDRVKASRSNLKIDYSEGATLTRTLILTLVCEVSAGEGFRRPEKAGFDCLKTSGRDKMAHVPSSMHA